MNLRRLLAAAMLPLLLTGAAGCRLRPTHAASPSTAAVPNGSSDRTITVAGLARTYHVYRPAGLTGPAPLVVFLHGGFGNGLEAERYYGWNAEADQGRFLVAYPDGLHRAWDTGGGCCGTPGTQGIDDVGFITAMVASLERVAPIDARRVYATGISNGGIMAYTLACRTSLFAAIGPDSATQLGPCASPSPTSVIHVHGLADTRIRYEGGEGNGSAHIDGPAVPALNATWRGIDHCAAPAVSAAGVVTTSVAVCQHGRAVELITIAGAGHQWPGSPNRPLLQRVAGTDAPSTALDATSVIWQFFSAHPLVSPS
ncbi:PHB depolymerase family esterase [Acidothermaceae bacterium B102]|nr:PHB depolymerase family esterase [Acidothermaceae bacterium B102]